MKLQIKGWPIVLFLILFICLIAHPIWKCAGHLEEIKGKIDMHFGPGPGDELIDFGPGPQEE